MSHGACGERSRGGSDTRRAGGWEVRCRLWATAVVRGEGGGGLGGVGGPELGSRGRWRVVVVGASCYLCPTTRK